MKLRNLVFTEAEREFFPLIYQGFLHGGNGPQAKGMEVLRREVRILDKLEAISEDRDGDRILTTVPAVVLLEQPEYELLRRYFENTPWTTAVSRKIVNIADWLSAIPLEANGG